MPVLDDTLGDAKRFTFSSKAVPAGTFAVVDLQGTEALSRAYEFHLSLISENPRIALDSLINQPATVTIHPRGTGQAPAMYHGLIRELDQAHQLGPYTIYRALLSPRVWDLSLDRISEVYLDKTTPQIIDQKLRDNGLQADAFALRLTGTYKPWPHLCQYQETDLDFVMRLMERDGIYYYFEQGETDEKLIITDAKSFHPAAATTAQYHPAAQLETGLKEDTLRTWLCQQRPMPKKVVLQDYNPYMAALALVSEAPVLSSGKGEVNIYGENFRVPDEGRRLAGIRAEELLCRRRVFQGEGSISGLRAGFFLQLEGHYRQDFNGRYLVTEVRHEGAQGAALLAGLTGSGEAAGRPREDFYRSACQAIPADVQFRPERVTPKSRIYGTMNAFVDAEGSGQYAELDDQGRYKVQLPFDKTDKGPDKASTWIRKATIYSGKDHGMHFPLHKGTEVLLSFVDGDPDRPIIMGTVYNSENPNLVTRNNQTQSVIHTAGGNRIAIEDREGSKRIVLSTPTNDSWLRLGAHNDPNPAFTSDGLALYTTDALGIQAQAWNVVVLGEVSQTVLGLTSYNYIIGVSTINIGWSFNITLGGSTTIALPQCLQFTPFATDVVGQKITAVETRLQTVETDVQAVDTRVDTVNSRITNVVTNIQDVESDIQTMGTRISTAETRIDSNSQRITNVVTNIQDVETDLNTVATRVDTAETQIKTIETAVSAVEMDVRNSGMAMANADLFIIS